MRIKSGYILRKVADSGVIVSMDEMDCNELMTVNQSGMDLWKLLEQEQDFETLVEEMYKIYETDRAVLQKDITLFLNKIREAGLLDE